MPLLCPQRQTNPCVLGQATKNDIGYRRPEKGVEDIRWPQVSIIDEAALDNIVEQKVRVRSSSEMATLEAKIVPRRTHKNHQCLECCHTNSTSVPGQKETSRASRAMSAVPPESGHRSENGLAPIIVIPESKNDGPGAGTPHALVGADRGLSRGVFARSWARGVGQPKGVGQDRGQPSARRIFKRRELKLGWNVHVAFDRRARPKAHGTSRGGDNEQQAVFDDICNCLVSVWDQLRTVSRGGGRALRHTAGASLLDGSKVLRVSSSILECDELVGTRR